MQAITTNELVIEIDETQIFSDCLKPQILRELVKKRETKRLLFWEIIDALSIRDGSICGINKLLEAK